LAKVLRSGTSGWGVLLDSVISRPELSLEESINFL
jgi:hypothetical protein